MVDTPTAIHKGNESCDFYDGQVSAGDPIVIRGAADEILGKGTLEASTLEYAVCSFSFAIDNVKAGQSGYTIKVGTFDPIIASEDEINTEKLGIY